MKSQRLNIQKRGNIHGGFLAYRLDEKTGMVNFDGTISGKKFFVPFNKPFSGSKKMDPEMFATAGKKVGDVIQIGEFVMTIQKIESGYALCGMKMAIAGEVFHGSARMDMRGETVSVLSVEASGKAPILGQVELVATA